MEKPRCDKRLPDQLKPVLFNEINFHISLRLLIVWRMKPKSIKQRQANSFERRHSHNSLLFATYKYKYFQY